jgi:serine/threonine protein kinase
MDRKELLRAFFKEAHILSMLRHPNVLSLFGVCLDRGGEMIVTEYVAGKSLFQLIQLTREQRRAAAAMSSGAGSGTGSGAGSAAAHSPHSPNGASVSTVDIDYSVSWPWTIQVMAQCAAGVGYLHSRGILHRDLKSANILVATNGSDEMQHTLVRQGKADDGQPWWGDQVLVKICDMGLATIKKHRIAIGSIDTHGRVHSSGESFSNSFSKSFSTRGRNTMLDTEARLDNEARRSDRQAVVDPPRLHPPRLHPPNATSPKPTSPKAARRVRFSSEGMVGTPNWSAPEVCRQEVGTSSADAWSFGVVCWEMLCFTVPFEALALAPLDLLHQVAYNQLRLPMPPPNAHQRPAILDMIKCCMKEDAEERPPFSDLTHRLQCCLQFEANYLMQQGDAYSVPSSPHTSAPPSHEASPQRPSESRRSLARSFSRAFKRNAGTFPPPKGQRARSRSSAADREKLVSVPGSLSTQSERSPSYSDGWKAL